MDIKNPNVTQETMQNGNGCTGYLGKNKAPNNNQTRLLMAALKVKQCREMGQFDNEVQGFKRNKCLAN